MISLAILVFLRATTRSNAHLNKPEVKAARAERVEAIRLHHAATDPRPSERKARFDAYKREVASIPVAAQAPTAPMPEVPAPAPKVRKPRVAKPKPATIPDPPAEVTPAPAEIAPEEVPEVPEVAPEREVPPARKPKPESKPRVHRDPVTLPAPKVPAKVPAARKTPRPLPTVKILGSGTASDADKLARYVAEMRAMREGA